MGLRSAVRSLFEVPPTSAVTESTSLDPLNVPGRKGMEYGIPADAWMREATETSQQHSRREHLESLYDLYRACSPVTITVNNIAKSVTAGGFRVVPDDQSPDDDEPAEPPGVVELKRLMRFTNPHENFIQIARGIVADLYVFADAYLEVSWFDNQPVALYSLDAPSMTVVADEHGVVQGYRQYIEGRQEPVNFEAHEIIHFSLDNPRGGVYGLSPVETVEIPATVWLHTMAAFNQAAKKGYPPRVHADLTKDQTQPVQRWYEQYLTRHLGPLSIGKPVITSNDGKINELSPDKYIEWLSILRDLRDIIQGTLGAPPNKVNVVESGNLGGGTGESQDKNWRTETVIPIQSLILEAFNFQVVQQGFGIQGWHIEAIEVDYRDTAVISADHAAKTTHGAWTVNRWRREIGEPPVDGGNEAFIVDRGKFIYLKDIAKYSQAEIDQMEAPMVVAKGQASQPSTPPDGNAPGNATPPEGVEQEFRRRYGELVEAHLGMNGNGQR